MPVAASDIQFRYSGGTTNTSANACLGGAMSTDAGGVIDDAVKNDLFDDVSAAEATAGDTEYRGFYAKNNHGTLTLIDARVYISSNTSSADTTFDIALADEAVNTTIETIANESTAPVGPTFTAPTTYASGLQLNGATGLTAGSYRGVWIRRTVNTGAAATSDSGTLKVEGETAP
jgi:hypothetical protein